MTNAAGKVVRKAWAAVLCGMAAQAMATSADIHLPVHVQADHATMDKRERVFAMQGNVVVSRGTLVLMAETAELRVDANENQSAVAKGTAGRQASFFQRRNPENQYIIGWADRIDYNGERDEKTLSGNARMIWMEGATVVAEAHGSVLVYDGAGDVVYKDGGKRQVEDSMSVRSPAAPGARNRVRWLANRGQSDYLHLTRVAETQPPGEAP